MNTDRYNEVIARADRVMRRIDERDGPAQAAARRERRRLNADLGGRLKRIGIGIGLVSIAAIVVGLIMPIGMFGFLAAVGLAIGIAAMVAFLPSQARTATAPAPDLPNGAMVQRFDSYIYRSRAALPAPAQSELDAISAALPSLKQTLERVDALDHNAQDARRLMSVHLPGLIDRYRQVPQAFRDERDGDDISVDERLVEGLAAGRAALGEITEKLARADVNAFETQGRFIQSRYGEERIDG
ncbi:hypothetical protein [Sphingomonas sp.]|uniref:hypothetical protein n=1 Tax=Sphingomonas sp. TaxID=28214 RepID=UPI002869F4A8|nr:hypothetical protein [Sphingomonas sp.]